MTQESYRGSNANQASRDGILQAVLLREQGNNPGVDGHAIRLALGVFGHNARSDLDLLSHPQDTLYQRDF